jgi:hypothetical protein
MDVHVDTGGIRSVEFTVRGGGTISQRVRHWSGWFCWDQVLKFNGKAIGASLHDPKAFYTAFRGWAEAGPVGIIHIGS